MEAVIMGGPIRLYTSMSLDGFIAGPDDRPGQELGRRGGRLFNRLDDLTDPDGYRIERVEWPTGHGSGITPEDFA